MNGRRCYKMKTLTFRFGKIKIDTFTVKRISFICSILICLDLECN